MRLTFRMASTSGEVRNCQEAIGQVYTREYGVLFSRHNCDLAAKIERWPHRYLMLFVGKSLAAVCGLYLKNTYVERFGNIRGEDLKSELHCAGYWRQPLVTRELSKLVVLPDWRGRQLAPLLWAAACSRGFLGQASPHPPVLVFCAKTSIARRVMMKYTRPRLLKEFPVYKVHENYRSEQDPMHSYLTIPEIDVAPRFLNLGIPGEYAMENLVNGLGVRI